MNHETVTTEVWTDRVTGTRGFLVVTEPLHMPAGGGIRVSPHLNQEIVVNIARLMHRKFQLIGPGCLETGVSIVGAGVGFCSEPNKITPDLMLRFFHDLDLLGRGIGTAASSGINVSQLLRNLGLIHLQEPIARNLGVDLNEARNNLLMAQSLVSQPVSKRSCTPSAIATGFAAVDIANKLLPGGVRGRRVGIVGFGACGGSSAKRLVDLGAQVTFVANSQGAVKLESGKDLNTLLKHVHRLPGQPVPKLSIASLPNSFATCDLMTALGRIGFDSLVIATPEGLINSQMIARIPDRTIVIPIANHPWQADVTQAMVNRLSLLPPERINIGTGCIFSLALMGCRSKNPDDLLNRGIAFANEIGTLNNNLVHWNAILPKFL